MGKRPQDQAPYASWIAGDSIRVHRLTGGSANTYIADGEDLWQWMFEPFADTRYASISDAYTKSASDSRYVQLNHGKTNTQQIQGNLEWVSAELDGGGGVFGHTFLGVDPAVVLTSDYWFYDFIVGVSDGSLGIGFTAQDNGVFFYGKDLPYTLGRTVGGLFASSISFFPGVGDTYGFFGVEPGSGIIGVFVAGDAHETGGTTRILHVGRATGNPSVNPTVGSFLFIDPADDLLKYRTPTGIVVTT